MSKHNQHTKERNDDDERWKIVNFASDSTRLSYSALLCMKRDQKFIQIFWRYYGKVVELSGVFFSFQFSFEEGKKPKEIPCASSELKITILFIFEAAEKALMHSRNSSSTFVYKFISPCRLRRNFEWHVWLNLKNEFLLLQFNAIRAQLYIHIVCVVSIPTPCAALERKLEMFRSVILLLHNGHVAEYRRRSRMTSKWGRKTLLESE